MSQRVIVGILLLLALVVGGVGLARSSYQAGLSRGLAEGSQIAQGAPTAPGEPGPGPRPYPYYGPYYGHGPWGFGFFGFLFPLLFLFLIFALIRGLFWRGHGGPPGYWGKGVPPMFEEWHRRAHESKGESSSGVTG